MLIQQNERKTMDAFFRAIRLKNRNDASDKDQTRKIEQILSYLEIIHSLVRKYSKKRTLVFIDSCAGNCYLSFLVYHYYSAIDARPIEIHCVDINEKLMNNGKNLAVKLGFSNMHFHTSDVLEYTHGGTPDMVYSLHACDIATDKALFLALQNKAKNILSVSCCQHTAKKRMRNSQYRGITRHSVFKERMLYMVVDSLRALLMEMEGYTTDIIEFTSSRNTDKNIMIRGRKAQANNSDSLKEEYSRISDEFKVTPALDMYLKAG